MIQIEYPPLRLHVAGQWVGAPEAVPVTDPASGRVLGQCPVVTENQLEAAVMAAHLAMDDWRDRTPLHRSDILRKAAALLRIRKEEIGRLMSLEQGKPVPEAISEVERAAEIIEWDAEEGRRLYARGIEAGRGFRRTIHREPLGVIAGFSPWNAPVGSPVRKISGPLAAGCGVVLKGAEETPACAMALVQAFVDAGVPDGLVNLVFGAPARTSDYLLRHPHVRGAAFTGSVAVGKRLAALCGEMMKPVVMELGGHAPVIIAADADIELAARGAISAKIKNAGQICTSPTRFFVAREVHADFCHALQKAAQSVVIGQGDQPGISMGPLATPRRLAQLRELVEDARTRGARITELAPAPVSEGCFMALQMLDGVPDDARIMQEEPFGPLLIVNAVDTLDAAIEEANALPYGLAAYAFSTSDRTLERLTDALACGNLGLNCYLASTADSPLGGVRDSGFGREGGAEGLLNYTYIKNVVKQY